MSLQLISSMIDLPKPHHLKQMLNKLAISIGTLHKIEKKSKTVSWYDQEIPQSHTAEL